MKLQERLTDHLKDRKSQGYFYFHTIIMRTWHKIKARYTKQRKGGAEERINSAKQKLINNLTRDFKVTRKFHKIPFNLLLDKRKAWCSWGIPLSTFHEHPAGMPNFPDHGSLLYWENHLFIIRRLFFQRRTFSWKLVCMDGLEDFKGIPLCFLSENGYFSLLMIIALIGRL